MSYHELSIEERATIQVGNLQGMGLRATARMLGRSPSTISREVRRNTVPGGTYQVATAQSAPTPRSLPPRKEAIAGLRTVRVGG